MWLRLRPMVFVAIVASLFAVPYAFLWTKSFGRGSDVDRWRRAPADIDRPRTWFDGYLVVPQQHTCSVREEVDANRSWEVRQVFEPPAVTVVRDSERYQVHLRDLATGLSHPAEPSDLSAVGVTPNPARRYRTACAETDDRVWIDGCIAADGVTIEPCAAGELAGALDPSTDLARERESRRSRRAAAIWFTAIFGAILAAVLARATWGAGHRLSPLVPASAPRALALLGAVPIMVGAIVTAVLGAPGAAALFPFAMSFPFAFVLGRAARFRDVAAQLQAPRGGMVVIEGTVGPKSPLGRSVLQRRKVAVSIVTVARVVRGRSLQFVPEGEVQDVGLLEVALGDGTETVRLDLENAVLELVQDAEAEWEGRSVPEEVRAALSLSADQEYRLREAWLDRGDPITVLVEGERVEAQHPTSAYRTAPARESVRIARRGQSAIFEGTRAAAITRTLHKARALELRAAVFGGLALVGLGWALAIALAS